MSATCREQKENMWRGIDAGRVEALVSTLRASSSTPNLSCTAVMLLRKTLSARATRLESSVSKVRLAAEKESLWRIAQAKRHRATGPKNATEFMKSTLLDRESRANAAKARATRKAGRSNLLHADNAAQAGPSNTFRCQRCTSPSSARAATIVNQTNDCHQASRFCRTSTFAPELDCGQILVDDVVPSPTKQVPPNSTARTEDGSSPTWRHSTASSRTSSCHSANEWCLENDVDVRILLDQPGGGRSIDGLSRRPVTAGSAGTATSRHSTSNTVTSLSRKVIFRRRPGTASVQGRSGVPLSEVASKGAVQRPHTANIMRRGDRHHQRGDNDQSKAITVFGELMGKDQYDAVRQLRREMLIRARGPGHAMESYTNQAYKPTPMGRRATQRRTLGRGERPRWCPAKTLNGLDRQHRVRIQMKMRPA